MSDPLITIGHYLVMSTADRAVNGELKPIIMRCASEEDVIKAARNEMASGEDYWQSYFGHLQIYASGDVSVQDLSATDLGVKEDE